MLLGPEHHALLAALGKNQDRWLGFLSRRAPAGVEADDLLQDALIRAVRTGSPPAPSKRDAWFYRILRNVLADTFHRHASAPVPLDNDAPLPPSLHADLDGVRAGDQAWTCECDEVLYAGLTAQQGDLVRRVHLQGEAVAPVAAALGVSTANAYVVLHRARQSLRDEIAALCGATDYASARACSCDASGCAVAAG